MSLAIGSVGRRTLTLLDLLPAPAVACSLRKLRAAYGGNCIQVRRVSDDAEIDIGFAPSGWLDIAALEAFCVGTDGRVATFYDQSGNGRNLYQNTPTLQPRIAAAGVVDTANGRPALLAASDRLTTTAAFAHASSAFTTSAVMAATGLGYGRAVSIRSTSDSNDYSTATSLAAITTANATWDVQSYRLGDRHPMPIVSGQVHAVHTRYDAGDVVRTSVDGVESTGSSYSTEALGATVHLSLLADDLDAGPMAGYLGEVVHWLTSLDATQRATLWASQAADWSI